MGQTIRHPLPNEATLTWYAELQQQQKQHERDQQQWLQEMPRTSEELELANRYKAELKALREAEAVRNSAGEMVATLVVNFGENGRVLPGLITGEERPTQMLVTVLITLCERAGLLGKTSETPS